MEINVKIIAKIAFLIILSHKTLKKFTQVSAKLCLKMINTVGFYSDTFYKYR